MIHKCPTKHRTYQALAKCLWKRKRVETVVYGEGAWACVQQCRTWPHKVIGVELKDTEADAREAMLHPCGGACVGYGNRPNGRAHTVVYIGNLKETP